MSFFNFNISHSGSFVILSADSEHLIGCDVEEMKITGSGEVEEFFENMEHCFCEYEWETIRLGLYDAEQQNKADCDSAAQPRLGSKKDPSSKLMRF